MSYWTENDPPMSFIPEGWTYEQKREFRFKCIPYLEHELARRDWSGKRVLCVGDGSGIDAVEIARRGGYVTMIDMSSKAVDLSAKHAYEAGVSEQFSSWVCDATNIKPIHRGFDIGEFYDFVYSFGVIHHIPDVERAVREIARVLKKDGQFIGMVYHRDSLLYAYSILKRGVEAGLTPDEAMRKWSERNPDCPHSIAYTREGFDTLLRACGLEPTSIKTRYDVIDLPGKRKVPFTLDGQVMDDSGLGWHLFFEAKK